MITLSVNKIWYSFGMAYIFDFFGVISSNILPWFGKYLPEYDLAELREAYINDADLGKLPLSALYEKLAELTNQSAEEVARQWMGMVTINSEVVSVIQKLGIDNKIALCSNSPSGLILPILKEHQLEEMFDVIVISAKVGMVKPNEDIFLHTLSLMDSKPNQAIFIDDDERNIEAAIKLGMKSVLYKNPSDVAGLLN